MLNYQVVGSVALFLMTALYTFLPQGAQKPDENRFTPVVVVPGGVLDEPLNFEVLRNGNVFIQERRTGQIKLYNATTKAVKVVGTIPVNHTYVGANAQPREAEEGLVGMTVDPNFEQNHFIYVIYAHPTISKHQLSRFEVRNDTLVMSSETMLLDWDTQRETCCHTGGGMTWDKQGNLYITVGNNTGNVQGSQTDQRAGRRNWDDQRGASNTNDLRGKILRIHPEANGTYTIPAGNLFPAGTPNTRPEIYTMGHRNAWRPSIDSRTGFLYWGEVGPDAAAANEATVEGYDELNQARGPGYFGWPYFIGPNRAYPITDYATDRIGPPKDPSRPINDSRWNNGLRELPQAQPAFISYPYAASERFPEVGSGGRCAVGGPVYHRSDLTNPARPWPTYFEGKWLATDCSRNWIMAISMNQSGDYQGMERFLPNYRPVEPIDMKFGPDGDLYVLEYGSVWFGPAPDAKLVRIEYNAGNRAPEVEITSNVTGGALPFSATLSSTGTSDPDNDALTYSWQVVPASGGTPRTFTGASATVPFTSAGAYNVTLTARDPAGLTASKTMRIVAGNAPPAIAVNVTGNRSFYFPGQAIPYSVQVTDAEDANVPAQNVALSVDYVPENFRVSTLRQGDRPADPTTRFAVAQAIMQTTDCRACHTITTPRSVGPSFTEVAAKYQGDNTAFAKLVAKVRGGGSGVWGDVVMPAHPGLSVAEASALVRYILASNSTSINGMPLAGSYTPDVPEGDNGRGAVVIRAVYTDRGGAGGVPGQTAEQMLVLRSPQVASGSADIIANATTVAGNRGAGALSVQPVNNGHIGFRQIDLTGIRAINLAAAATAREGHVGGTIEIHIDSPTGQLIGQTQVGNSAPQQPGAQQLQNQGANAAPAAGAAPRPAGAAGGGGGGGQGGQANTGLRVDISPVTGAHDLYFVFKNPTARPTQPLLNLSTITFSR